MQVSNRQNINGAHGGVPKYFRAWCFTAQHGGGSGYADIGYSFSSSIGNEVPDDIGLDDWVEELDKLLECLKASDEDGTWKWFKLHYPAAMKLIPSRRREQFLLGVEKAWDAGKIAV